MSSERSITSASMQRTLPGAPARIQWKTGSSSGYTPNFSRPPGSGRGCSAVQGYLHVASRLARVRFRPWLWPSGPSTLGSRRERMRSVCALPSNPPTPSAQSFSARSPLCPNGGWPRSWLRQAVSTTSGDRCSAVASSRPTCATSSECVRRFRAKSAGEAGLSTWVFAASRRSAAEWSTRARSRANPSR